MDKLAGLASKLGGSQSTPANQTQGEPQSQQEDLLDKGTSPPPPAERRMLMAQASMLLNSALEAARSTRPSCARRMRRSPMLLGSNLRRLRGRYRCFPVVECNG